MERIKRGAELAAWRHGYQVGESSVPGVRALCPYTTGSILAKAWQEGYQKARDELGTSSSSKPRGSNDQD